MKYLIKPKFNNCILVETQWGHKKDKSKSATEICWYRFQKYEVELADGADIDQLKQSETINLSDTTNFKSYIEADDQGGGDLHYQEWDHLQGTSEDEEERINDNAMYELKDWVEVKSTLKINCPCEFTALKSTVEYLEDENFEKPEWDK